MISCQRNKFKTICLSVSKDDSLKQDFAVKKQKMKKKCREWEERRKKEEWWELLRMMIISSDAVPQNSILQTNVLCGACWWKWHKNNFADYQSSIFCILRRSSLLSSEFPQRFIKMIHTKQHRSLQRNWFFMNNETWEDSLTRTTLDV